MGVSPSLRPDPARLRLGVYGGAFDPPHLAHVAMARAFVAQCALDSLWVVPTGHAWHKPMVQTPAPHRLAMAELAFAEVPQAVVDDRELKRPGASYTIDTLEALAAEHPNADWHVLMGLDQWLNFRRWHRWEDIARLATITVAERAEFESVQPQKELKFDPRSAPSGCTAQCLDWQPVALSSTRVRAHWGHTPTVAESTQAMVPAAVARYISRHQLYTPTTT